jgi:Right handed beta helix region
MRRFLLIIMASIASTAIMGGDVYPLSSAKAMGGRETQRDETQRRGATKISGFPEDILALQSNEPVEPTSIDDAVEIALAAADDVALELIESIEHNGEQLIVPDNYGTIQGAINAAEYGDIVLVKPGTYYELLVMKDGVKLVSDSSDNGDELIEVAGARMLLPRRALRTIIDGTGGPVSEHGMIDFEAGLGRHTVVDGFTIRNLPLQNHHIPGHAHALNVRGASPIIMNCYIRNNGSTGIGCHVVYQDQDNPVSERDFRWENIIHFSRGVIYRNIVAGNNGLGIGCNHFSTPEILGNEVLLNSDDDLEEETSPGMGAKHGSAPRIIGNIIHGNSGGGILVKVGDPQGVHQIDRPTHPTVLKNVVYGKGRENSGISSDGGGSDQTPVRLAGNFVYDSGLMGIALQEGAVGIIEDNLVAGSGSPGISVKGATAIRLNYNKVTGATGAAFVILEGGTVLEMIGNAADANPGARFVLLDGTIETASPRVIIEGGDYNGDGSSDIAVFRPSSGLWSVRGITRLYFGASADTPVPGDYNGDGITDIGIFRESTGLWAVRGLSRMYFGSYPSRPVPGDYNGDDRADISIFRDSIGLWAIHGITRLYFGADGDEPVPGDYTGDGITEFGIFRGSTGLWAFKGATRFYWGSYGDRPYSGDFNGDGTMEGGIFRSTSGLWGIKGVTRAYYGAPGDIPVPGDYNGNTADGVGVFRESTGLWAIMGVTRAYHGITGDIPITR